jgi:hypothetical protein
LVTVSDILLTDVSVVDMAITSSGLFLLGSGISVYCLASCLSTFLEVRQPVSIAMQNTNIFILIFCFINTIAFAL